MPSKSEIAQEISEKIGIEVFSFEYSLILDLYERGTASSGELKSRCRAASTAFHTTLRSLHSSGLIVADKCPHDGRVRRYRLADTTRSILDEEYAFLQAWHRQERDPGEAGDSLTAFIRNTRRRLKVRFFSCEYQILLLVYEFEPCSAGDLLQLCEVSSTTFYTALRRLAERSLILATVDDDDHRVRKYQLPAWVRVAQDQVRSDLADWAQKTLGET